MAKLQNLPKVCPSCGERRCVCGLRCTECGTRIDGLYGLPVTMQLPADDQLFILDFVKSSGSLKEMARKLGLSYPTVRNRLDDIIAQIQTIENNETNH